MFGNSLTGDYTALMTDLAFTPGEIRKLILNGIESSWLDSERKLSLRTEFTATDEWTRNP